MTTILTPHFTLEELTASHDHPGIPNVPTAAQIARLLNTAEALEEVRALLGGHPLVLSSGFRCPALNAAVGGSKTSDHMNGDAADFECPGFGTPMEVADAILASGMKFDQLIREYGWVHISRGPRMRQQALTKRSAKAPYESGINA